MGRYQSPLVKHDLSRLEDPEARQIALTSLKNCVKQLEPDSVSFFLDQIAEAHQDVSRPYVISLYGDIARVHQTLLVPYIPRIMEALISALSESGSSLHVREACGKVVAGLSKYCIDLERLSHQAKDVLRLLCEPLLCVLVGKFEPVSAGAAVCLQALVESENWPHAPKELVNEVCFRVTAAVAGKSLPTVAHMQLAITMGRVNRDVFESFGLELLAAGKYILQSATLWNLRVAAAQLINLALGMVDGIALSSEIASVMEVLEKFRLDRMPKVRSAVGEALKTARACYYSGGGATTKMIFSVGDDSKLQQHRGGDQGIGSILLPGFQNDFGGGSKRDSKSRKSSVVSRNQRLRKGGGPSAEDVVGVDFVIVEDYGHPQYNSGRGGGKRFNSGRSGKRGGCESPRVRHTVSAEPGGYVIQEWIKVDDRFPGCGMLAGIDEGEEYYESPVYGHQFYSPLSPSERQVVIFDEDHAATTTCKRLIEESEMASSCVVLTQPEEPSVATAAAVISSCSTAGALQPDASGLVQESTSADEEWSVRDNPIATKSDGTPQERSVTPPRAEDKVTFDQTEAEPEQEPEAADPPEMKPTDVSSLDSAASNDGSSKMSVTEEMVDTFRRSWEVLETEEQVEVPAESPEAAATCSSGDQLVKAISSSFIEDEAEAEPAVASSSEAPVVGVEAESSAAASSAGAAAAQSSFIAGRSRRIWIWRKVQSGVEVVLGGSVCAALALPAAMALIKCLEQTGSVEMVPT